MHVHLCLAVLGGLVVALAVADPNPTQEDMAGMKSALEYLQQLDKFYSQMARPR